MKRLWAAALALFLLPVLVSCGADRDGPELLEPMTIGSDLAPVKIGNIYDGTVLTASVLPRCEELSFPVSGRIGEICVTLGEKVKKGDPIVRLDTKDLEERCEDLREELQYARKMDEFDTRAAELNEVALAGQTGWDSPSCQLYINEREAERQERSAQIAKLQRKLEQMEKKINVESVIAAPCDGEVAAMTVCVGDTVKEKQVVAAVADDSACFLKTDHLEESSVSLMGSVYATVGGVRYEVEYVPMKAKDYAEKKLAGSKLFSTFELKGGESGLIGQYAMLYLMSSQREQVLNIPSNALQWGESGYYVYVQRESGRVRQEVKVGLKTAAQAEILSGLKEGEMVYVAG